MLVSILIPAYNAAPWLAQALDCALEQTWLAKEIIVVDDGSNDKTLEVARAYESRGVKVFSQLNSGASTARNYAFRESKGDYIQYLDADDLMAPDKIEKQMVRLNEEGYPKDILVSGRFAYFSEYPGDLESEHIPLYKDFTDPLEWVEIAWNQGYFIHVAGWLTPRNLIESAGSWNESLSLNDDGEFFGRLVLASRGILYCNNARTYYRKVTGSLSKSVSDKALQSLLQTAFLYEKHLLCKKDTPQTRLTCANVYMRILHFYYPNYYRQLLPAETAAKRLGGGSLRLMGNKRVQFVEQLIGWKATRRLILFLQEKKLNPRAIVRKIGIQLPDNRNKYT
ncbi:MAG: glycosyltransferase [Sphingobacteriales bacterium]|nr:MAG: glycosyltransferase [Sphingobacteriales bacterium]